MENLDEQYLLRGKIVSLASCIDEKVDWLIADALHLSSHEVFLRWLRRTPIPAKHKVRFFKDLYEENTTIPSDIYDRTERVYVTRNFYAHSPVRQSWEGASDTDIDELRERASEADAVNKLLLNMIADFVDGPMPPISAEDVADWPI